MWTIPAGTMARHVSPDASASSPSVAASDSTLATPLYGDGIAAEDGSSEEMEIGLLLLGRVPSARKPPGDIDCFPFSVPGEREPPGKGTTSSAPAASSGAVGAPSPAAAWPATVPVDGAMVPAPVPPMASSAVASA